MKKLFLAGFLAALPAWASAEAKFRPGDFGVGVMIGRPTGLSAKYWVGKVTALDFGLGFGDLSFHGDYLWHVPDLFAQPREGKLPAYWGLGARVEDDKDDTKFGVRAVGGLAYWFPRHPVELFGELVPFLELTPDTDLELDGAIGVRIYFTARRR